MRALVPIVALLLAGASTERLLGAESDPRATTIPFEDASDETGLDVTHFNGMTGELYLPEITGSGLALFDYDGDGDLDLYVVQGSLLGPEAEADDLVFPAPGPLPIADRLLRADLGPTGLRWFDVTEAARIDETGYGMAVSVGDVDGDGDLDLYVSNLGSNSLLENRGDGTFVEGIEAAGADDTRWSTAAVFFHADEDDDLDLYVGNYVDFTFVRHRQCATVTGAPDYCGPLAYEPETDRLFVNRGDGTFEDASSKSGIGSAPGNALGAVAFDVEGDLDTDLYVANDQMPNFLWVNDGTGRFTDEALLAGAALNMEGQAEASMGVDAGDVDGDGDEDLFMAHLSGETNTLYLNDGRGMFRDASTSSSLGAPSWSRTAFGTGFVDYDNDGLLDVLVVNGAVKTIEGLAREGSAYPFHEPNQLFHNVGGGRFEDVTEAAGEPFTVSEVSRGLAFGDVDGDGDPDAVVSNNSGPIRLLRNSVGSSSRWIRIDARSTGGGPAIGAVVEVDAGERTLRRRIRADGSYASSNDPRALVGLGSGDDPVDVTVRWPRGERRLLVGLPRDATYVLPHP